MFVYYKTHFCLNVIEVVKEYKEIKNSFVISLSNSKDQVIAKHSFTMFATVTSFRFSRALKKFAVISYLRF